MNSAKMDSHKRCIMFLNPVLPSPWSVDSSVCYFVPKKEPSCVRNTTSVASFIGYVSVRNHQTNRKKRRPSLQEIAVKKLSECYPELPKRKITAALIICDYNFLQAISLLELKRTNSCSLQTSAFLPPKKRKFVHLSSQISLSSSGSLTTNTEDESNTVCVDISLEDGDGDQNDNDDEVYSNNVLHCQCSVPPLGSFPRGTGVMPVSSLSPDACTTSSAVSATENYSTATVNSGDVYEFSESDSAQYCELRRPSRQPVNKVGVVLKRSKKGAYTVTLM